MMRFMYISMIPRKNLSELKSTIISVQLIHQLTTEQIIRDSMLTFTTHLQPINQRSPLSLNNQLRHLHKQDLLLVLTLHCLIRHIPHCHHNHHHPSQHYHHQVHLIPQLLSTSQQLLSYLY